MSDSRTRIAECRDWNASVRTVIQEQKKGTNNNADIERHLCTRTDIAPCLHKCRPYFRYKPRGVGNYGLKIPKVGLEFCNGHPCSIAVGETSVLSPGCEGRQKSRGVDMGPRRSRGPIQYQRQEPLAARSNPLYRADKSALCGRFRHHRHSRGRDFQLHVNITALTAHFCWVRCRRDRVESKMVSCSTEYCDEDVET